MNSETAIRWVLKPTAFIAGFIPCGWLVWAIDANALGADPLAAITKETGIWALRFLALTLTVTPLRRFTGWNAVIRLRRMLGLYAFFYGTLHLLIYVIADRLPALALTNAATLGGFFHDLGSDVLKRPFITVGFAAWLGMVPLAATSTARMIRWLGGRRWQRLHRLIYAIAGAAVLHYWWLVKADVRRPVTYGIFVAGVLALRLPRVRALFHGRLIQWGTQ